MTLLHPVVPDDARSTSPSDAQLILAVRAGDRQAYGTLYERHLAAARAHARQLTWSSADADDLVAEAFAKVFTVLRAGRGPDGAFRAYLMTTLRNGFYQRARQDRRLDLSDDMARHDEGVPWSDPVEAELNSALAARAFSTLPARWKTVLWRSEVEGESTAEIGARLGLRPNAVAALAYRAREGLRQAYLQAHLTELPDERCRPTVGRLGGWTRGKLASGDAALVSQHLDDCGRCRHLAAELADVNDGIRGLLAPLALAGTTAGYASAGATTLGGAASIAAVGATVAPGTATGAAGGGSVIGSTLGWLLGTHAGQAAAVLTAVVVGGTAVAAGTGAVGVGDQGPASAAAAEAGAGQAAVPVGGRPDRAGPRHRVVVKKGEPSSGKKPSGKSAAAKGSGGKPAAKQPNGRSSAAQGSGGKPAAKQPSGTSSATKAASGTSSAKEPSAKSAEKASTSKPANQSAGRSSATKAASGQPVQDPTMKPAKVSPSSSQARSASARSAGTDRISRPRGR